MWTKCQAGYYSNNGTCKKCLAGTYSFEGASSCIVCAKGTYSSVDGATSCTTCPAGQYNTTTGNTSCSACPKGKYCTGGTNQTNCPAGKYRNATGGKTESDCTACAKGTYSSEGAATCTTCPAGQYNTTTGNTSCSACPKGKYCTGGTNQTNCPANTYRATTGGKKESDCTSCGTGKTSPAGSDASSDCVSTSKTFKGTFKTGNFSVTTQEKTCTTTSSSCSITSPTFSQSFYNNYSDLIAEAGWNKTNNTNDASYYGGQKISISANTTFYSSLYLQSTYFSTSSNNGTNGRSCASTSCGIVNGLNIGHTFVASGWAYAKNSGCSNNLWLYGYSEEEGWTGYVCSYYTYPW